MSSWWHENGLRKSKYFTEKQHGLQKAKQLAIAHRRKREEEQKLQGCVKGAPATLRRGRAASVRGGGSSSSGRPPPSSSGVGAAGIENGRDIVCFKRGESFHWNTCESLYKLPLRG